MDLIYKNECNPIECAEEGIQYKKFKNVSHPYISELIGDKLFYEKNE